MIRTHTHISGRNWFAILTIIKRAFIRYRTFGFFVVPQNIGAILLYVTLLKLISFSSSESTVIQGTNFEVILPGLLIFAAINHCFTDPLATQVYDKLERIIQDVFMSPMDTHDILLSILSSTIIMLIIQLIPLWLVLYFFGLALFPVDVFLSLFLIFISAILISLFGTVLGLYAQKWDHVSMAVTFLFLPLAAFSGCFFPVSSLPESLEKIISFNVLARIVESFRSAWIGVDSPYNLNSTLITIIILIILTYSIAYRLINKRLRQL